MRSLDSPSDSLDVADGTNLDAARPSPGKLLRDLDGLIHVLRFDEIEASENLFGLTERTVGDFGTAAADANGLCRLGTFEHLAVGEPSIAAQLVGVCETPTHHPIGFGLGQRVVQRGVVVNHENEFHSGAVLPDVRAAVTASTNDQSLTTCPCEGCGRAPQTTMTILAAGFT